MYNHAKSDYKCPICLAINGVENGDTMIKQDDIIYRDEIALGIISSKFIGNNPGHVVIFPKTHFENVYDLPDDVGSHFFKITRLNSIALKEVRRCDGITIAQYNEPASGQHAFHYHTHIIPRFVYDNYIKQQNSTRVSEPSERVNFANELKTWFSNR